MAQRFIFNQIADTGVTGLDVYGARARKFAIDTQAVLREREIEAGIAAGKQRQLDARYARKMQMLRDSADRDMKRAQMQETARLAKERETGATQRQERGFKEARDVAERPFDRAREVLGAEGQAPQGALPALEPGLLSPEAPPAQGAAFEALRPPPAGAPMGVPAGMGAAGARFEEEQAAGGAAPAVPAPVAEARAEGERAVGLARAASEAADKDVTAAEEALRAGGLRSPSDMSAIRLARRAAAKTKAALKATEDAAKALERQTARKYIRGEAAGLMLNDIYDAPTVAAVRTAAKKALAALGPQAASGIRAAEERSIAKIQEPAMKAAQLEAKVKLEMLRFSNKTIRGDASAYNDWVAGDRKGPRPSLTKDRKPNTEEMREHEYSVRKILGAPISKRLSTVPANMARRAAQASAPGASSLVRGGVAMLEAGAQAIGGFLQGAGTAPDAGIGEAAIRTQAQQKGHNPEKVAAAYRAAQGTGPGAEQARALLTKYGYRIP